MNVKEVGVIVFFLAALACLLVIAIKGMQSCHHPCTVIDKRTGRTYEAVRYYASHNHIHLTTPDGKHVLIQGDYIQEFE